MEVRNTVRDSQGGIYEVTSSGRPRKVGERERGGQAECKFRRKGKRVHMRSLQAVPTAVSTPCAWSPDQGPFPRDFSGVGLAGVWYPGQRPHSPMSPVLATLESCIQDQWPKS